MWLNKSITIINTTPQLLVIYRSLNIYNVYNKWSTWNLCVMFLTFVWSTKLVDDLKLAVELIFGEVDFEVPTKETCNSFMSVQCARLNFTFQPLNGCGSTSL